MTVSELKKELEKYPDDMWVFLAERKTEFDFGLLNGVGSQYIEYNNASEYDDDSIEPLTIDCVVLGEI